MAQFGRYNPQNSENASALFTFQEVPLTSTKINRWNGNLVAAFELLHRVCSSLCAKNNAAVITSQGNDSLQAQPLDTPDMRVRILPGWAILNHSFAGLMESQTVPVLGRFQSPASNPRIDLIVLTGEGELDVVDGTESTSPSPPSVPGDSIPLAQVYHRVGSEQILAIDDGVQSYLIDARPRLLLGESHYHGLDISPQESPDGVRRQFFTRHTFRSGSLELYVNGVLQEKGVDYAEDTDCRGYTFTYSPLAHFKIQHRYIVDYELE